MGRPAGYDPQQLIRQARDLFWRRGFDAVSVADVEQATGVGRSSIYHAHGNMRGLFDAAVEDYLDTVVRPRLQPLTTDPVAPEAILDFLTALSAAIGTLASNPDAPQWRPIRDLLLSDCEVAALSARPAVRHGWRCRRSPPASGPHRRAGR